MTAVLMVTSALLFAGQVSDDFVKAARAAYAKDDGCRKSIVYEHSGRHVRDDSRPADGVADDKNPGRIVKWIDVDGVRNVRDIGGWTGLRTGRVFRGTELGEALVRRWLVEFLVCGITGSPEVPYRRLNDEFASAVSRGLKREPFSTSRHMAKTSAQEETR